MESLLADMWAHREEIASWALTVLVASTALVHAFQAAAHALERYAESTANKTDDKIAHGLAAVADRAALALDVLASVLPKIGRGGVRR